MAASRTLQVVITGDASKAQKALGDLERTAGRTSKGTKSALGGIKDSIVGVGLAAGAFAAIREFDEAQKVARQTEAVIKATGGAANVTAGQVGDLAEEMSRKTAIDDDAIQAGQNWLLTFKNVRNEAGKGNDIFNQASETMLDLSVAMGSDAKSAANLLGKALNDPVKGITALSRAGVTFTDQQKEQIKALTESGDLLGAQKIILQELNSQVGGSAEAQATAWGRTQVALGELAETMGSVLAPAVEGVANVVEPLVGWFSGLDEGAQRIIATAGLGAIAYMKWSDSISNAGAALKGMRGNLTGSVSSFGAMNSALAVAIPAIAAYAATTAALNAASDPGSNAELLARDLEGVATSGRTAADIAESLGTDVDGLAESFKRSDRGSRNLGDRLKYLATSGDFAGDDIQESGKRIDDLDKSLAAMVSGGNVEGAKAALNEVLIAMREQGVAADQVVPFLDNYSAEMSRVRDTAANAASGSADAAGGITGAGDAAAGAAGQIDGMTGALDAGTDEREAAKQEFEDMANAIDNARSASANYYRELFRQENAAMGAEAALDSLAGSFDEHGKTLDDDTEAGRANKQALLDYVQSAATAASETDNAEASMNAYTERLRETLAAAGYTKTEIDFMVGAMKVTPKDVSTRFHSNADELLTQAKILKGELDGIAGDYNINFTMSGDPAVSTFAATVAGALGDGPVVGAPSIPAVERALNQDLNGNGEIGRAKGGPVTSNRTYLVGEEGPELFTTGRPGTIIPNKGLGGGGTNVVVNVGGSVVTERELVDVVIQGIRRETRAASGISPVGGRIRRKDLYLP